MRFHMGVSFRLKTIKKFLFPILIGILAYFGFGFFSFIHVNALTNYDTSYTIEPFDWDTYLSNVNCGGENLKDVVDDFIENYDNTYFQAFIYADYSQDLTDGSYGSRFYIYLIPKNHNRNSLYWYGDDNHNFGLYYGFTSTYNLNSSAVMYRLTTANCSANSLTITNTTTWNDLLNAMNTGYGNYDNVYNSISTIDRYNYSIWELPKWASGLKQINSLNFNNTDSFTIENVILPYYSSEPLYFNTNVSSSGYFLKNLIINGNTYTYGDEIPTYVNLPSPTPPEPTYIGYQDSLKSFYTNLDPININSYQLKVHFRVPQSLLGYYQEPQDYIDNTTFDYICSGRVDNTNYYTYESFPCSLTSSYVLTDSTIDYTFNNLTISQSLSNYDKLYVTVKTNYLDSEVSTTLYNYSYTYTLGSFFNTDYKGAIYEDFTSLPLNFRMYLSSNNSLVNSDVYVKNFNYLNYGLKFIGFSNNTQQQNLVVGQSVIGQATCSYLEDCNDIDFIKTNVSNNIDTGIMIYQQDSAIPVIKLELFFNSGIVLSINNNSNSDSFYYIDNQGVISSGNFVKPLVDSSNNYDISFYINQVNNFIDDLATDSLELSAITQNIYNGLPLAIQTFILVIFILSNIYFVYVLIRK